MTYKETIEVYKMKRIKTTIKIALGSTFLFANFMLLFGLNGQAYIDPSVITYLIQIVSGVVISLGAFFGVYGRKIKKVMAQKLGFNENAHKEVESDDVKIW